MTLHTHTRLIEIGFVLTYLSLMGAMLLTSVNIAPTLRNMLLLAICAPSLVIGVILIIVAKLARTPDDWQGPKGLPRP